MTKVQILGERCSGTNFLERLLISNFNIECVWSAGWKHWPERNLMQADVTYIYIHRNIDDWTGSNVAKRHHVPKDVRDILQEKWVIGAPDVPGNGPRTLLEQRAHFLETIFHMQSGIHYWVDYDWLCNNQVQWMSALNLPRTGSALHPYRQPAKPGGGASASHWSSKKYPKLTLPFNVEYETWATFMINKNIQGLGL